MRPAARRAVSTLWTGSRAQAAVIEGPAGGAARKASRPGFMQCARLRTRTTPTPSIPYLHLQPHPSKLPHKPSHPTCIPIRSSSSSAHTLQEPTDEEDLYPILSASFPYSYIQAPEWAEAPWASVPPHLQLHTLHAFDLYPRYPFHHPYQPPANLSSPLPAPPPGAPLVSVLRTPGANTTSQTPLSRPPPRRASPPAVMAVRTASSSSAAVASEVEPEDEHVMETRIEERNDSSALSEEPDEEMLKVDRKEEVGRATKLREQAWNRARPLADWSSLQAELRASTLDAESPLLVTFQFASGWAGRRSGQVSKLVELMWQNAGEEEWRLLGEKMGSFRELARTWDQTELLWYRPFRNLELRRIELEVAMGMATLNGDFTSAVDQLQKLVAREDSRAVVRIVASTVSRLIDLCDAANQPLAADQFLVGPIMDDQLSYLTGEASQLLPQQDSDLRAKVWSRLGQVEDPVCWIWEVTGQQPRSWTPPMGYRSPQISQQERRAASLMLSALANTLPNDDMQRLADFFCSVHDAGVEVSDTIASQVWLILHHADHSRLAVDVFRKQAKKYEDERSLYGHIMPLQTILAAMYNSTHLEDVQEAKNLMKRLAYRPRLLDGTLTPPFPGQPKRVHVHNILGLISAFIRVEASEASEQALRVANRYLGWAMVQLEDPEVWSGRDGRGHKAIARDLFSRLLFLYARRQDMEMIDKCLKGIKSVGELSLVDYNCLLHLFVVRGSEGAAMGVYGDLIKAGQSPDSYTINALMLLCARRNDIASSRRLIDRARERDVSLHPITLNTMLNLYVDEGHWKKAAEFYRDLDDDAKGHLSIITTMLKGLVKLSAPYKEVESAFRSAFPEAKDASLRCWTLLIQSACDSGDMATAKALFDDLSFFAANGSPDLKLNNRVFSVMMVGYMRVERYRDALLMFNDLLKRELQPNSVVYGSIVRAIAQGRWPGSSQVAVEGFVNALLHEDGLMAWSPGTECGRDIENIVTPMIIGHQNMDAETAEKYVAKVIDAGQPPSIPLFTILMNTYRRKGDRKSIQMVAQTWERIQAIALQAIALAQSRPPTMDDPAEGPEVDARSVCFPLSIYIDAMSEANRHDKVLEAWKWVHDHDLAFDAHNYNHMIVALVRAGQPQRAFDMCERRLMPIYGKVMERPNKSLRSLEEAVLNFKPDFEGVETGAPEAGAADPAAPELGAVERDASESAAVERGPKSALAQPAASLEEPSDEIDEEEDYDDFLRAMPEDMDRVLAQRPPSRRHQYRGAGDEAALKLAGRRSGKRERASSAEDVDPTPVEGGLQLNLAVFDQWRPSDIVWRPFFLTVTALEWAYGQLEKGRKVMAVGAVEEEDGPMDPANEDSDLVTHVAQLEADIDEKRQEAKALPGMPAPKLRGKVVYERRKEKKENPTTPLALLARLDRRCAKTVALIALHRRKKQDWRRRNGGRA